jgi:hypothetical protein
VDVGDGAGDTVGLGVMGRVVVTDGPVIVGSEVAAPVVDPDVVVVSQHPQKLPGVSHVVVVVVLSVLDDDEVVVVVGVVLSLQPNQPGVLQVEVDVLVVVVVVAVPVVVSSKQPHQPGVLQVSVLVLVLVEEVELEVVVVSVPLLSYIFQLAQSRHSGVNLHSGTSSYLSITSLMTDRILWVPMPTRQPLSATTS